MSDLESFEGFQKSVRDRLDDLKGDLIEPDKKDEEFDTKNPGIEDDDKKVTAHAIAMKESVQKTHETIDAEFDEWKPRYKSSETAGEGVHQEIDDLDTVLETQVGKVMETTEIGALRTALDDLRTDVEDTTNNNTIGKEIEEVKEASDAAEVASVEDDILPPELIEAQEQAMAGGMLGGKFEKLLTMFFKLQKSMMKFQRMMCRGDKECIAKADEGLQELEAQYDSMYGPKELRSMVTDALEESGIELVHGKGDAAAFAHFLKKLAKIRKEKPGKTRQQLVDDEVKTYLKHYKRGDNHVTTLTGVFFKQETIESTIEDLMSGKGVEIAFGDAGNMTKYNVEVKDETTIVIAHNGKTVTRSLTGKGVDARFKRASFDSRSNQFVLSIADGEKYIDEASHSPSGNGTKAFLDQMLAGPITTSGKLSKMFGLKEVPYEITLG